MPAASGTPAAPAPPAPHVAGAAIVHRLYDVGYAVALGTAAERLGAGGAERVRPARGEAQAILIKNPPLDVALGAERVRVGGDEVEAAVTARIFDFGVVSLRLRVPAGPRLPWAGFVAFGGEVQASAAIGAALDGRLRDLVGRLGPAVVRPALAPVTEDYVVFRADRLCDAAGAPLPVEALRDEDVAALLLDERRPLSAGTRRDLTAHRFSYRTDDLAVLSWNAALVVEPDPADADVPYVIEFANAQLLELRVYDALLDAELPRMLDRVQAARGGALALLRRGYSKTLADIQTVLADSTEFVERVENSFKVTDDVYLARVYSDALEVFRARAWRAGIDRKLGIIRETYAMLHAEGQAARMEALEAAIVVLIVLEIVLALLRH